MNTQAGMALDQRMIAADPAKALEYHRQAVAIREAERSLDSSSMFRYI